MTVHGLLSVDASVTAVFVRGKLDMYIYMRVRNTEVFSGCFAASPILYCQDRDSGFWDFCFPHYIRYELINNYFR